MSIGRVRPSVEALPAYRPGKAAEQAEEEHGIVDAIKLASNENPYAPVPSIVEAVAAAAANINRYPDHLALDLRAAVGRWIGVAPEQVTAGCGSVGLLRQICMAFVDPGDEVVYPWLSFEAYPISVTTMGGVPVTVPLDEHHAFDLDAVGAAVTERTKAVLLATPNNPTGTACSTEAIAALIDRIPDDVIVLVDEAYREFADPALGDPVADLLPRYRNVIVCRTFSKAYGLAGLRTGYAVADPDLIVTIDKVLLPFTNNMLAQAGAIAAIDATEEIQPRIELLLAERTRLVTALTERGLTLPDAQANFVYLPLGERTDEVHLHLERHGVVTRPFSGNGIRITVGTPEENDRIIDAYDKLDAVGS
ncbi:MAG: histidinol-phosphate transaminase [Actinomycetota bacterium]